MKEERLPLFEQVEKLYSGDQDGAVSEDMKKLDTTGEVGPKRGCCIRTTKMQELLVLWRSRLSDAARCGLD